MRPLAFAAVAAVVIAVGCSSKDETPPPGPATPDASASSSGGDNDGGAGGKCATAAEFVECLQCCNDADPQAGAKLASLIRTCMCRAENCAEACKDTLCAATPADYADGSPCDTCLQEKDPVCSEETDTACGSDAVCRPVYDCIGESACNEKP